MRSTARKQIASEVRAEVARSGVSLAELSASTGIGVRVMGRKLNGSMPIGVEEMILIAEALGVRPSALINAAQLAAAA